MRREAYLLSIGNLKGSRKLRKKNILGMRFLRIVGEKGFLCLGH